VVLWTPISYAIAINQATPLWSEIAQVTLISAGGVALSLPLAVTANNLKGYAVMAGLFLIVAGIWLTNYAHFADQHCVKGYGVMFRYVFPSVMCVWITFGVCIGIGFHCGLLHKSALDLRESYPATVHEAKPALVNALEQASDALQQAVDADHGHHNDNINGMSVSAQLADDILSFSADPELYGHNGKRLNRGVERLNRIKKRRREVQNQTRKMGDFDELYEESMDRIDELSESRHPSAEEIRSGFTEWLNNDARNARWDPDSPFAKQHGLHDNHDEPMIMPHGAVPVVLPAQPGQFDSSPDGNEI